MPLPLEPDTPPITPRSSNQALSGVTVVRGLYDTAITEYNNLNAQLRSKIQDYEIALLKMQLKERDKELQAILRTRDGTKPEKVTTDLMLMVKKQQEEEIMERLVRNQEEQIKELKKRVAVWQRHALKARDLMERTYWDMSRVSNVHVDGAEKAES